MKEYDGVPLKAIAETPGFDPVRTWGPGPLLLIQAPSREGNAPLFNTPNDEEAQKSQGNPGLLSTDQLGDYGPLNAFLAPNAAIVPIRKTNRNSFDTHVTIGRARNNDIRLNEPSVSKVHAYIFPPPAWPMTEEGGWRLRDANSTNGTAIIVGSGEITAPTSGKGLLLQPGAEIRMGRVVVLYVDADSLRIAVDFAREEWLRLDMEAARRGSSDTQQIAKVSP